MNTLKAEADTTSRQLRESQEMKHLALGGGRLGTWMNDLVTREVVWDAHTHEIFSVASDEPATIELLSSLIHPEDRTSMQAALERAVDPQSDGACEHECRIVWPDGQIRWISWSGKAIFEGGGAERRAIRLDGVVMDVTQRKLAEQALEESEARYRHLIETMNEGLIFLDANDLLAYVNPRLSNMLGYSETEMIGRPVVEFFDEENRRIFAEQLGQRRSGKEQAYTIIWRRKDGGNLPTLNAPAIVTNKRGEFQGSISVITDISEQVRACQMLEQRLAERTHELHTLLEVSRVVAGNLELDLLIKVILEQLKSVVDFSGAAIFSLADHHISTLNFPLLVEEQKAALLAQPLVEWLSKSEGFMRGEAIIVADLQAETARGRDFRRIAADNLDIHSSELRSWMGIALIYKGKVNGILSVHHHQPDYYTPEMARLASAFANQAAVAIENAWLYHQARINAAAEERSRLARELHDSVTQALYSLTLFAEASRVAMSAGKLDAAMKNLDEVAAVAREGMSDLRLLIFELRPPILEKDGLLGALQARLEAVEKRSGIQARLHVEGQPDLSQEVETELYWSLYEALNNVLKHARAKNVALDFYFQNRSATVTLRDDGQGFDPSRRYHSRGMGLRSIAERVSRLGGSFKIESEPGQGTVLEIKIWE